MIEIKKQGKGHEITINGEFYMYVNGSKKGALRELKKHSTNVYNAYINQ